MPPPPPPPPPPHYEADDSDTIVSPHTMPDRAQHHDDWAGVPPPTPRPPPDLPSTDGTLKPWLGLRARLFLSPISVALVSLIFVAARMLMSAADIDEKVGAVKANILATCHGAEAAASTLASLPTVMARNANVATAKAVEATVQGTGRVLMLSITAIEEILKWLVDSYRSLFVCFIELLVRGSLAVLIGAVELISEGVQETAQGIRTAIQASVEGVNTLLSTTISGINAIVGVFGQHVDAPSIQVPSLDALSNISLPHAIEDGLLQLNSSLPTLDELRQRMDALIAGPFETMKQDVNRTIAAFHFDHAALPIPPLNNVTFCHKVDVTPLDDLAHDLKKLAFFGVGLIALLMVGLALLCMGREWWDWRSMRKHVEYTKQAWESAEQTGFSSGTPWRSDDDEKYGTKSDVDAPAPQRGALSTERIFTLLELSKHPLLALLAFKVARVCGITDPVSRARLRWWLSFVTHPAAMAALVAGIVGLLSIQLQILAVRSVQGVYEGKLVDSFDTIASSIASHINEPMASASTNFAAQSNAIISSAEAGLNDHLFSWVNTTTTTMNATLNEFMDGLVGALNGAFGNTPLNPPLQTFVQCLIGRKVAGIQTALEWMHENAHVNFSRVEDDALLLGNDSMRQLTDPIRKSLIGGNPSGGPTGGDNDDGVVGRIVSSYLRHLEAERIVFFLLLSIYAAVLAIGTAVVFWDRIRSAAIGWRGCNDGSFYLLASNGDDAYPHPPSIVEYDAATSEFSSL